MKLITSLLGSIISFMFVCCFFFDCTRGCSDSGSTDSEESSYVQADASECSCGSTDYALEA